MTEHSPSGQRRLILELKRRPAFRAAAIYAAGAFILLQAADLAVAPLHVPPGTMTLLWILALAGSRSWWGWHGRSTLFPHRQPVALWRDADAPLQRAVEDTRRRLSQSRQQRS